MCLTGGWSWSMWPGDSCSLRAQFSFSSLTWGLSARIRKQITHREASILLQHIIMSSKADLLVALVVFSVFVCAIRSKTFRLPVGSSARLWAMIWRMRVETGADVTLDSCPSLLSVRVLSPELPPEWSRDSSNFYNYIKHTSMLHNWGEQTQSVKVRNTVRFWGNM